MLIENFLSNKGGGVSMQYLISELVDHCEFWSWKNTKIDGSIEDGGIGNHLLAHVSTAQLIIKLISHEKVCNRSLQNKIAIKKALFYGKEINI